MVDVEKSLELPGAPPFIAMGGARMKQWVVVPAAMLRHHPAAAHQSQSRMTPIGRRMPVSYIRRIALAMLAVALGFAACAGPSDEERCRTGGGVWRQNICENSSR
jgi:hypothetical protein